ncbi:MAG: EpsG family protein [Magnetococcales bacterium]|nr:EpsG family protein [Magnetococcales bacterium]
MIYLTEMTFYYAVPSIFLFLAWLVNSKTLMYISIFAGFFTIFDRTFAYDSISYINIYNGYHEIYEPSFVLLVDIFKFFGADSNKFLFFIPVINVVIFYFMGHNLFKRKREQILLIAIWMSSVWYISYSCNAMRQGFASLLIWYGLSAWLRGMIFRAIPGFVIGAMFHWSSAFLFILFITATRIRIGNSLILNIFIGLSLALLSSSTNPLSYLSNVIGYFDPDMLEPRFSPNLRLSVCSVIFLFHLINSSHFDSLFSYLFNIYKLHFFMLCLMVSIPEGFSRIHAYIWPLDAILLTYTLSHHYSIRISKDHRTGHMLMLYLVFLIFATFVGFGSITSANLLGINEE